MLSVAPLALGQSYTKYKKNRAFLEGAYRQNCDRFFVQGRVTEMQYSCNQSKCYASYQLFPSNNLLSAVSLSKMLTYAQLCKHKPWSCKVESLKLWFSQQPWKRAIHLIELLQTFTGLFDDIRYWRNITWSSIRYKVTMNWSDNIVDASHQPIIIAPLTVTFDIFIETGILFHSKIMFCRTFLHNIDASCQKLG